MPVARQFCTSIAAIAALLFFASGACAAAFPGAAGWAANTPGGRGGQILKVTSLNSDGPGTLLAALRTKGPRIIVFEVGGVIDLNRHTVWIKEPYLTIAGQTAPSPGITLIRGGVTIQTHDVIVQHIRVRTGDAGLPKKSGFEIDGMSTAAADHVIIDHCSMAWATDENGSASGKRFMGATPDEWRAHTSHDITFSNNIYAEGLSHATHAKDEHSKGSLLHDNTSNILIFANLYAHNTERNVLLKGGVRAAVINNLIYDPGKRILHYDLVAEEWGDHPYQTGALTAVGNVARGGPSTQKNVAFFALEEDGDVAYYAKDNIAVDRAGAPLAPLSHYGHGSAKIVESATPPLWPEGLSPLPATSVEASVLAHAGARPWDRDAVDKRIIAEVQNGSGHIIDSQDEVGGYPSGDETRRPFDPSHWNLDTMTER